MVAGVGRRVSCRRGETGHGVGKVVKAPLGGREMVRHLTFTGVVGLVTRAYTHSW